MAKGDREAVRIMNRDVDDFMQEVIEHDHLSAEDAAKAYRWLAESLLRARTVALIEGGLLFPTVREGRVVLFATEFEDEAVDAGAAADAEADDDAAAADAGA